MFRNDLEECVQKKKQLGQFFTTSQAVQDAMVGLLTPVGDGVVLEPSVGAGHLVQALQRHGVVSPSHIVGWEVDPGVVPSSLLRDGSVVVGDFFELADTALVRGQHFDAILGNPPYVSWKDVLPSTKQAAASVKRRYSGKTNLYHLFIDRCIDLLTIGGEMVLIVPKEWFYTTSATELRRKVLTTGRITHIIDGGEESVFPDASIAAFVIFRYVKEREDEAVDPDEKPHRTAIPVSYRHGVLGSSWEQRSMLVTTTGLWVFLDAQLGNDMRDMGNKTVGDFFSVKVGFVSGGDRAYDVTNNPRLEEFIAEGSARSYLTTTGVKYLLDANDCTTWEEVPPLMQQHLLGFKEYLMDRRVRVISEKNWWRFGAIRNAAIMDVGGPRIYCLVMTRSSTPFSLGPVGAARRYNSGLLGMFPTQKVTDAFMKASLTYLNSSLFRNLCQAYGMTSADKVTFAPKTLEALPFPEDVISFVNGA